MRSRPSVLLVSMPWTALGEPSLGLAVLRAVLGERGVPCRVRHLNLFMLRHLQATTYLALANTFALNDFVFSAPLDGPPTALQRRWLRSKVEEMLTLGLVDRRRHGGLDGVIDEVLRLRAEVVPAWLEEEAEEIARSDATLVGFTCMFDQTIASLALARLVKERAPDKLVALGGYALRAPTGEAVMHAFPWVDAVCTGEGEEVIGALADVSCGRGALADVRGILARDGDGVVRESRPARPVVMDASPVPDFHDFFADLTELENEHAVEVQVDTLPYENSRGCWWGATKHCVFCGIADEDLLYRARSAESVIAALDELHARHGLASFRFSDYILPHRYHRTLLPQLAARPEPYRLSCEMKSNSSPERFELMAAAGFHEVQPGIESFSSDVLRKMDKGVTAARNVQTLLLGRRHGIHIHYNLLWGLPDDDLAAYQAMAAQLPRLAHLDPPLARTPVQITRYAPLQADPERFGIPTARAEPCYELVFSKAFLQRTGFDLNDYCYYFARPFENPPALAPVYRAITDAVDRWKAIHVDRVPVLEYDVTEDGGLRVLDSRESEDGVTLELSSAAASVCEETAATPMALDALVGRLAPGLAAADVERGLAELDAAGLVFQDEDRYVGLALPSGLSSGERTVERAWAVA